ncbi:MAG: hypothetical protein UGF89_00830 [Acutalibacteraceae bacterium]|nr:hypothetical protein [Acutalibacteraceae bacterium]
MQKIIVEETIKKEIFVAEDGTKFTSERECENHERDVRWANILRLPTRVAEFDDVCPLNYDDYSENSSFVWFKLTSPEELAALNKLLPETVDGFVQTSLVCVENRFDDYYTFVFEDSVERAVNFFTSFGMVVELSPAKKCSEKEECSDCLCSSCVENQSVTVAGYCSGCEQCGKDRVSCLIAETTIY